MLVTWYVILEFIVTVRCHELLVQKGLVVLCHALVHGDTESVGGATWCFVLFFWILVDRSLLHALQ